MTDGMDARAVLLGLQAQDLLQAAWIEDARHGRRGRFLPRELRHGRIRVLDPAADPEDDSGADISLLMTEAPEIVLHLRGTTAHARQALRALAAEA